jgi:hypothetical protein
MTTGEFIGTIGVSFLLIAFALNLLGKMQTTAYSYIGLNIAGAALAGLSSYMINFWPFVVLETVWMLSSIAALFKKIKS